MGDNLGQPNHLLIDYASDRLFPITLNYCPYYFVMLKHFIVFLADYVDYAVDKMLDGFLLMYDNTLFRCISSMCS